MASLLGDPSQSRRDQGTPSGPRPMRDSATEWESPVSSERRYLVPAERRRQILDLLRERGSISVVAVEEEFGVSPMTARRDLALLAEEGRARRTHGGAVLPELAAHEDSFDSRFEQDVEREDPHREGGRRDAEAERDAVHRLVEHRVLRPARDARRANRGDGADELAARDDRGRAARTRRTSIWSGWAAAFAS